ncbi:DUF2167 domain-containing protein [Aminobacter sp. UC22_36]|uniref:DUF2167 domain-containing protein n=1 Tax=Aminobacter sp. UC22_36 TaxID=3374549 RepID=UPI003757C113
MTRYLALVTAAALACALVSPVQAEKASEYFSDYAAYTEKGRSFLDKIEPVTGSVELPNGVNLDLKDKFYFVNSEDARAILTEAWGNPPDSATQAAGMIFPGKASPLSDTWGIELRPDLIGYVNDEDAASIDYDELLTSMKSDTLAGNEERTKAGYEPITLLGWAQPPKYDAENKRLYWAKELKFGNAERNTLNYDVRFLNREGVLVMSYIASMDQLPEVNGSLTDVLNAVSFDPGKRYSDYVPSADKVAAVGVGGLIAGKVVAKTGLLVVALVFLKKFGVLLFLPLAWVWRRIRGSA